ncbi:subtilisin-like endopeptidase [Encephalitozoon romaleae SJ-2008]|uniref:Subtilisin-like endopeptidase n=1 Tax=Encephalitozoon romaleae (strain SJ-2008) TaxID=1178016 RepID=I6ZHQ7_ENCRO|nr:subtilisin-like endopeptidase [Encephalitozoon romaleae SJ-2008]AFN82728.1 subtilisin-like endopeptidase [Encephalitozoon romaleae SJ-2008]
MLLTGVMIFLMSQWILGNEGIEVGEAVIPGKPDGCNKEENPPGILFQKENNTCGIKKAADLPSADVQIETQTIVKEIVVEVEGPNEDAQVQPIAHYEGQEKISDGLTDLPCKDNSRFIGVEKCYILIKDAHDGDLSRVMSLVENLNGKVKRQYTKNATGMSFCSSNEDVLARASEVGMRVEEDKIYGVSAFQNNIPNYMYLMKHYENILFNNYFYDNWFFRVLQVKKMIVRFLGFYEYYHTGKGVSIFLLDTTAKPMNNVCNLSGSLESCNIHGDMMAELLVGKANGFAKGSHLSVLDVVGCDGKVTLSEMIYGLENLGDGKGPGILVFGVSGPYSEVLNSIVDRISSRGIIVVTPAGNFHDQSCNYSPGSSRSAINVGSVNKHAGVSKFSNHGDCVRIFALGEEVLGNSNIVGTSLSAAIVASSIALFLEASPRAAFPQIWEYLNQNSFWNTRGSYSVLKIPRLRCEGRSQRSIFSFGEVHGDVIAIGFIFLTISILSYLLFIGIRYFRRRGETQSEDILFDPPIDRF